VICFSLLPQYETLLTYRSTSPILALLVKLRKKNKKLSRILQGSSERSKKRNRLKSPKPLNIAKKTREEINNEQRQEEEVDRSQASENVFCSVESDRKEMTAHEIFEKFCTTPSYFFTFHRSRLYPEIFFIKVETVGFT